MDARNMKKTSWHFVSVGDIYRGSFINEVACTAEEALIYCRRSMGAKIQYVY